MPASAAQPSLVIPRVFTRVSLSDRQRLAERSQWHAIRAGTRPPRTAYVWSPSLGQATRPLSLTTTTTTAQLNAGLLPICRTISACQAPGDGSDAPDMQLSSIFSPYPECTKQRKGPRGFSCPIDTMKTPLRQREVIVRWVVNYYVLQSPRPKSGCRGLRQFAFRSRATASRQSYSVQNLWT